MHNEKIESYFDGFRTYIDNLGTLKKTPLFKELEIEGNKLSSFCDKLNNDKLLISNLRSMTISNRKNLRFEDFLISDLCSIYKSQIRGSNKGAAAILNYYLDTLGGSEKNVNMSFLLAKNGDSYVSFMLSALKDTQAKKEIHEIFSRFSRLAFGSVIDETSIENESKITEAETELVNIAIDVIPENDTLEKVLDELNSLIGLKKVKDDVNELINLLKIQNKRNSAGLKNIEITLHNVFLGPPGTGKTTVARLLARIYKHLGFLTKGQMYETDREGLVAGYVGQTATKVNKVVEESLGGVLFIDEAYSLTPNMPGNDFGAEAINTLLKRMEDNREDLSVVVAGYTEPMKMFIESNPGLRSRFNRYFEFDHFTTSELLEIFETFCKKGDFIMTDDAREKILDTFALLVENRDASFGNARVVRNFFEKCVQNQANRIVKLKSLSKKTLKTFTDEDVAEPKKTLEQVIFSIN